MSGRARMRSAVSGVVGAVVLTLTLSGCGGGGAPEIAADVEGTKITSAQVEELYNIFANTETGAEDLQGIDGVKVEPKLVRQRALTYRIKIAFMEYLAKREGAQAAADSSDNKEVYDELAEVGSLKFSGYKGEDLQVAARMERISKAIAAKLLPEVSVSREELQAAYDARPELVGKSFRATTGIAFMDSEESAAALRKELAKGTDFTKATDALAGTVVAETVDVNPITPIQPELIEQIRKLDPGETSEPQLQDVGGVQIYTVLYQVKRKDLPALTLEEAKPELTQIVIDAKRFQVFDDWLKKQYLSAKITVDKYYGKWEPAYQGVV